MKNVGRIIIESPGQYKAKCWTGWGNIVGHCLLSEAKNAKITGLRTPLGESVAVWFEA